MTELVLLDTQSPTYYFFYTGLIDHVCHYQGTHSKELEQELEALFNIIEQTLYTGLHGRVNNTLCMLIADHGQVEVHPQKTFYLNKELPHIESYLRSNRRGNLLVPAGSARDMFLYVKEECIDDALDSLRTHLNGRAEVYKAEELLLENFFGRQPLPALLERVGNVVILPYEGESVWWYEQGRFEMPFVGHHGGVTRGEMEIPFLLMPV